MYTIEALMEEVERKNPAQPEFHQAVKEVLRSIIDTANENPVYEKHRVIERLLEPDRTISFRVEWEDDAGELQVNRGYRIQYSNTLGPYKGGIRFHSSVTPGTLKFLAFEQTLKNSLTTLPMGGGKGGSDFNPRGKSDNEIMRFCRSYMTELAKYIGATVDVPAGDIGVGAREIGYLYGQYKRIQNEHTGAMTGKAIGYGGSLLRPEATGFGALYFAQSMLATKGDSLAGKRVAISGFGNVAWGAAMKATELGAKVVAISGPDGYIYDEEGVGTPEKWAYMTFLRLSNNDVVAPYAEQFGATFVAGRKPWEVAVDIALPCAIQNELNLEDAKTLVENRVQYVIEVSNMGCRADAVNYFIENRIPFAPGKAANAGGVSVSGLEMSQNAMHISWTAEEVDEKLHQIMNNIHAACLKEGGEEDGYINYVKGANITSFKKVADAMVQLGY